MSDARPCNTPDWFSPRRCTLPAGHEGDHHDALYDEAAMKRRPTPTPLGTNDTDAPVVYADPCPVCDDGKQRPAANGDVCCDSCGYATERHYGAPAAAGGAVGCLEAPWGRTVLHVVGEQCQVCGEVPVAKAQSLREAGICMGEQPCRVCATCEDELRAEGRREAIEACAAALEREARVNWDGEGERALKHGALLLRLLTEQEIVPRG